VAPRPPPAELARDACASLFEPFERLEAAAGFLAAPLELTRVVVVWLETPELPAAPGAPRAPRGPRPP